MGYTFSQLQSMGATAVNPNQSASTNAYQSFIKNNLTNSAPPIPAAPPEEEGILGGIAKDAVGTLVAKPAVRVAQAMTAPLALQNSKSTTDIQKQQTEQLQLVLDRMKTETDPVKHAALRDMALKLVKDATPNTQAGQSINRQGEVSSTDQNVLGIDIKAQQGGMAGVKQIAGDALKSASYLATPEAIGVTGEATTAGGKILTGAGTGAAIGAAGGAGNELQNPNSTAGSILKATGEGAVTGAAIGGVIPAAVEGFKAGNKIASDLLEKTNKSEIITPKLEKLSPEQQDIQNNITQTQKEVEQAKTQANFAAEQRKTATPQAVEGVKDINTKVSGNLKTLGEQFGSDAAELEKANPNVKLSLTNEQIDALGSLKENKNFTLPEKLQQAQDAQSNLPQSKFGNIKLSGKALEEFNAGQKATQVSLSPTEAQGLIKELNRSTFRQNADGSITKDYQRLGITNEIKKAASEAFGEKWDAIYSKYSQGRGMIDRLDSIVNLDSKVTPEDLNKQLEGILKQSKTPEGKLLLQQAVDEYKQSSGVDLNDPIKSIQQIADKQTVLDEANSSLSDAQKAANKAQRDADIAKLKQEQKMSTFKGRHPILTQNLQYELKRAVWGLTGGAILGALGLSGVLKKIFK